MRPMSPRLKKPSRWAVASCRSLALTCAMICGPWFGAAWLMAVLAESAHASSFRVRSLQVISPTPPLPHAATCLDPGNGPPSADAEPALDVNLVIRTT
jgi:hypothetical protein